MKVIELLTKIAKEKEYPKIKFNNSIYEYHDKEHGYCRYVKDNVYICLDADYYLFDILNDEVEVIGEKEKDKKIERIMQLCEYPNTDTYECWNIREEILVEKINEIIDYINGGTNGK